MAHRGIPPEDGPTERRRRAALLTTDDIVARLRPRQRWLWPRRLIVAAAASSVAVGTCFAIAQWAAGDGAHKKAQPTASQAAQLPAGTAVLTIRLSRLGSVFVDGQHAGMQRRVAVPLTYGPHAVSVRFGTRTFQQMVHMHGARQELYCDAHRGFKNLGAAAHSR